MFSNSILDASALATITIIIDTDNIIGYHLSMTRSRVRVLHRGPGSIREIRGETLFPPSALDFVVIGQRDAYVRLCPPKKMKIASHLLPIWIPSRFPLPGDSDLFRPKK